MEQLELQSSKIKCSGCVANIEKGLVGFAGISEVDVESNIVSLQGNELDKKIIANKLKELGYPVV